MLLGPHRILYTLANACLFHPWSIYDVVVGQACAPTDVASRRPYGEKPCCKLDMSSDILVLGDSIHGGEDDPLF
jgi:hypothetical protein